MCTCMDAFRFTLTDLPNEILVQLFSLLETRTILQLRTLCRRFRTVTGDPILWSAISWRANNRITDVRGLKFALRLSKGALMHLSLHQGLYMSKCIDQILTCHSLESISLKNVIFTKAQVTKLLHLPALSYLQVDQQFDSILNIVAASSGKLKTLTLINLDSRQFHTIIEIWSRNSYIPLDLRISGVDIIQDVGISYMLSCHHRTASHDALLSFYHTTYENSIPLHPILQFSFSPSASLSLVRCVSPAYHRITFYSDVFSGRFFIGNCSERKIKLEDVCHNITELCLRHTDVVSSELELFAELCPNLKHLNIGGCVNVLSDLKGLNAVASGCPKLQELKLLRLKRSEVECLDKLWTVMASMFNLRVLFIPMDLVPKEQPNSIPMPRLTAIHMDRPSTDSGTDSGTRDHIVRFMVNISSLEYFCWYDSPSISGISNLLRGSPNLTHFLLSAPCVMSLPTDPLCYTHLQHLHLICGYFEVDEDLTDALVQSKNLRVLVLDMNKIAVKEIVKLATSLEALRHFHVTIRSLWPDFEYPGASTQRGRCAAFTRSIVARCKELGRIIDFVLHLGDSFHSPKLDQWPGFLAMY